MRSRRVPQDGVDIARNDQSFVIDVTLTPSCYARVLPSRRAPDVNLRALSILLADAISFACAIGKALRAREGTASNAKHKTLIANTKAIAADSINYISRGLIVKHPGK